MRLIQEIAIIALAAVGLFSCRDKLSETKPDMVQFACSVRTYSTETGNSSMTNLGLGERVRIVAGPPIGASSVGTVSGTAISLDPPIFWKADQKETVCFSAVCQKEGVADAGTSIKYNLLDGGIHDFDKHNRFLTASSEVEPGKVVNFELCHPFCKISINVLNSLYGNPVSKLEMKGVIMEGTLDITSGSVNPAGSKVSFQCNKLSDRLYEAIIMPQKAKPTIVLTTASGAQYSFALPTEQTFNGGYAYSTDISVGPDDTPDDGDPANFSFSVKPWEDGLPLEYSFSESDSHA